MAEIILLVNVNNESVYPKTDASAVSYKDGVLSDRDITFIEDPNEDLMEYVGNTEQLQNNILIKSQLSLTEEEKQQVKDNLGIQDPASIQLTGGVTGVAAINDNKFIVTTTVGANSHKHDTYATQTFKTISSVNSASQTTNIQASAKESTVTFKAGKHIELSSSTEGNLIEIDNTYSYELPEASQYELGGIKISKKLDEVVILESDGEENHYFGVLVDKDGKAFVNVSGITGGSGGPTTAENVTYDNTTTGLSSVNVQSALDALYDMINWTALSITDVTMSPTTTQYEVGTSIPTLKFTWKTSKTPSSSPTVTGNTNGGTNTVTWNDTSKVYECSLANQIKTSQISWTYTINAPYTNKDGKGTSTATSSKSISWKYKVFYGYTLTANIDNVTYAGKTGEFLYDTSKTITNIAIAPGSCFWIAVQEGYKVSGIKNLNTNADETFHTRTSELTYTLPNNGTTQYKIYYVSADGNFTADKGFQITFATA